MVRTTIFSTKTRKTSILAAFFAFLAEFFGLLVTLFTVLVTLFWLLAAFFEVEKVPPARVLKPKIAGSCFRPPPVRSIRSTDLITAITAAKRRLAARIYQQSNSQYRPPRRE